MRQRAIDAGNRQRIDERLCAFGLPRIAQQLHHGARLAALLARLP
jgi:hypothetical protein